MGIVLPVSTADIVALLLPFLGSMAEPIRKLPFSIPKLKFLSNAIFLIYGSLELETKADHLDRLSIVLILAFYVIAFRGRIHVLGVSLT